MYDGGSFEQLEPELRNEWNAMKDNSRLSWDEARHAVRAGWQRLDDTLSG